MLVGVFADTHDNVAQILLAIEEFKRRQVRAVLHAGDIVSLFAARAIAEIDVPLYIIYGNNEGEIAGLKRALPGLAEGPIEIVLDGCRIAMAHDFPEIGDELRSRADVLVAGHTHVPLVENRQGCLWVNPGECCGWVTGQSTIAVLDTDQRRAEIIELPLP